MQESNRHSRRGPQGPLFFVNSYLGGSINDGTQNGWFPTAPNTDTETVFGVVFGLNTFSEGIGALGVYNGKSCENG